MAQQKCHRGDPALHEFRAQEIRQPLHNAIPEELLPRFDPVYVDYYNKYNAGRLHTHEVPIEEYRKDPAKYTIFYGNEPGPDVFRITEQQCPVEGGEITIRIFEPVPKIDDQGQLVKRAAYINFHGGGWVFGGLNTDHDYCKRLVCALDGDVVVFDVNYRLSPEHRFPIPWRIAGQLSTGSAPRKLRNSHPIQTDSPLAVHLPEATSLLFSVISVATRRYLYAYRF